MGRLKGSDLERMVREKAFSYFGKLIRKCKLITPEELSHILYDALERGVISEGEIDDAERVDVVATGHLRDKGDKVVVVAEVSITCDKRDVERARRRAEIISRAMGLVAVPVTVVEKYTEGARTRAKELDVKLIQCEDEE